MPGAESHVSACGRCSRASLSRGRRPGDEETRPFLRGLWVPGALPSRPQHHAPPVQWSLRLRASHTLRQHVTRVDVHGPAVADCGGLAAARPTARRASLCGRVPPCGRVPRAPRRWLRGLGRACCLALRRSRPAVLASVVSGALVVRPAARPARPCTPPLRLVLRILFHVWFAAVLCVRCDFLSFEPRLGCVGL